MKQKTTYSRELKHCYLHSDGTLVQWFEERRDGNAIGETADATLGYADVSIYAGYSLSTWNHNKCTGRICISAWDKALLAIMKGARVTGIAPSPDGGSENTKRRGIDVGYLKVNTKHGELTWTILDSLISGVVTIQPATDPEAQEKLEWREGGYWGNIRIAKVTDLRKLSRPSAKCHNETAHTEVA